MVCEEGGVMEVGELEVMSSGPSVHTSSRVPKTRRQSRTLGLRFSQYSNSCSGNKEVRSQLSSYMHVHMCEEGLMFNNISCHRI